MEKISVSNTEEDIENRIIDWITLGSGGRVVVFKPEKVLKGADLIAKKRSGYEEKEISFKINSCIGPAGSNDFIKTLLQNDFKPNKEFYLLFVYFDEIRQEISDHIWVVPSLEFKDIADSTVLGGKKALRFEASLDIKKKNKFSKFLLDKKDFVRFLIEAFEKNEVHS
ncbi:MAG: hypothetical protein CEN87_128 [Parcubacteria group bacterium Licking1014_1]|nr:MAG: hypothetical protein CEN87_128 [Parcubacteria group bacterium Licking1014_1]